MLCKIENCNKDASALGLCAAHRSKLKKYGDPLAGRTNSGGTCEADGCVSPVHAHRLCVKHYARFKKHGDPSVVRKVKRCAVSGCTEKYRANGYCEFHNGRARHHDGDPLAGGKRKLAPNSQTVCRVDGCGKKAACEHLCSNHWQKLKKYGDPLGGYVIDGRSKEWHVRKGGYIIRFDPTSVHANVITGIVFQHRQVMGEIIGRPLTKNENVHHKNGDRADNRPENLELWCKSQPPGQRVIDLVAWAQQIIADYSHLVDIGVG